jgi:hypothetical protein
MNPIVGKGIVHRPHDKKKLAENWERIFGNKEKKDEDTRTRTGKS